MNNLDKNNFENEIEILKREISLKEKKLNEAMSQREKVQEIALETGSKTNREERDREKIKNQIIKVKRELGHLAVDLEYNEKKKKNFERKIELGKEKTKISAKEAIELQKSSKQLVEINSKVIFIIKTS